MQDRKGAVQPAASADHEAVGKPQPPANLWESLAALSRVEFAEVERPTDSFTVQEYATKFGVSDSAANYRLMQLMRKGKVKRTAGTRQTDGSGRKRIWYYQLTDTR